MESAFLVQLADRRKLSKTVFSVLWVPVAATEHVTGTRGEGGGGID